MKRRTRTAYVLAGFAGCTWLSVPPVQFNVTRERIRQIENQSLKKLGKIADAAELREVAL